MANTNKKVNWKVDGMTCSNCALTIQQYLKGQGMNDVKVDLLQGDVSFDLSENKDEQRIIKGIENLGYSVQNGQATTITIAMITATTPQAKENG